MCEHNAMVFLNCVCLFVYVCLSVWTYLCTFVCICVFVCVTAVLYFTEKSYRRARNKKQNLFKRCRLEHNIAEAKYGQKMITQPFNTSTYHTFPITRRIISRKMTKERNVKHISAANSKRRKTIKQCLINVKLRNVKVSQWLFLLNTAKT